MNRVRVCCVHVADEKSDSENIAAMLGPYVGEGLSVLAVSGAFGAGLIF